MYHSPDQNDVAQKLRVPRDSHHDSIEKTMLPEPANWKPYYDGTPAEQKPLPLYSYGDRIRNYCHRSKIPEAVDTLISNLSAVTTPESLYSGNLSSQYVRLRSKQIEVIQCH
ncbi:class II D-tagatose-bisphosphate aldolase non-catalytic subunit [Tunturiibacter gelidoferens]|uniref:Tagatose-1,6-bisphosphate aldolase non-catalytic subunit AgaZ/GatZ n=1 Tax=Tunturiibacter gelidiferens TaxID=3069689 RepID=A0A9X0QEV6_9BACT|nr:tagatose-1,6-bisphosphate aldolase non-catalytic subunit AgaZ/GatZ [Edaphobacter lichenicola]